MPIVTMLKPLLLLLSSIAVPLVVGLQPPVPAAPWWENYGDREYYTCSNKITLKIRRNDHQASIENLAGLNTLFRDREVTASHRYTNDQLVLHLRGDELELEYGWTSLQCRRVREA